MFLQRVSSAESKFMFISSYRKVRTMTFVLLLTGASSAIAKLFVEKSATHKLVAVARSEDKLVRLVEQYGEQVTIVPGDVADEAVIKSAVELSVARYGQLDAVVANAGVLDPVGSIADANLDRWRRLYEVNFFSVVALAREAIPPLRKSRGKFIAVASGASTANYSGWGAYGSSKAALNHLVGSIAESEPEIQAVSVAPGVVNTAMQRDIREVFHSNMKPEAVQKFLDLHKNDELLPPEVPATVYVNLALKGFAHVNGKYLRYNDPALSEYLSI